MSDKQQIIAKNDNNAIYAKDKRSIGEEGGRFNDHEYHEITDEEINNGVVSPRFETFDFGPSLMDEVFKELDIIKPEFTDDLNGQQKTINDCNSNVKNEIKEIVNKLALNKDKSNKNKTTVKPISPAEEQNLDSAIAMAKELATLSMMEFEFKPVTEVKSAGDNVLSDSPRTPTSPNKKKFSFKFKHSPKIERKNFSEQATNISDVQSILTEEAKVAYSALIEKGEGLDKSRVDSEKRHVPITNVSASSHYGAGSNITSAVANSVNLGNSNISQGEADTIDLNPLRLLRNGFSIIPKVKGNKQRIAATPQTASLARLTANVNRSNLGAPPPPPAATSTPTTPTPTSSIGSMFMGFSDDNSILSQQHNALPLPPRDRTKQFQSVCLKQHQRKHPLIIPGQNIGSSTVGQISSLDSNGSSDIASSTDPPMSSFKPHLPVLKHGLCNDPQPSYVNYVPPKAAEISDTKYSSAVSTMSPKRTLVPHPPPKPNRSFLNEEPLESKLTASTSSAVDNHAPIKPTQQFSETKTYDGVNQSPIKTSSINCRVSSLDYATSAVNKPSLARNIDSKEPDPDEVRVMQKVLANEIQLPTEECIEILRTTGCDIHKAIKCVRLRETLKSHSINIDCNWAEMLARFNWNIRQASNYLIATQGLPEDTTEV